MEIIKKETVTRYKYKELLSTTIGSIIFLIFVGYAVRIVWLQREEHFGLLVFFAIFFLLMVFVSVSTLHGLSDIVIDDHSISNSFFGCTWQSIRWTCIKKIHVVSAPDIAARKVIRIIYIHQSSDTSTLPFLSGGRMILRVVMENPNEFIEQLNHYITEYKIPVERTQDGGKSEVDHI